jgi:CheY-like chemotaxis protein
MAKVVLIGLEQTAASQIGRALSSERHEIQHKSKNIPIDDLLDVDIVFAGGDQTQYLTLLRRIRASRPTLPFVVVTRRPETSDWLDALEAGATDYCSAPFEPRQINWLPPPNPTSDIRSASTASCSTGIRSSPISTRSRNRATAFRWPSMGARRRTGP